MSQIHSVLGKERKACVRMASFFDAKMDEFEHTPSGRNAFAPLLSANFLSKIGTSRKCSKLRANPCAFLLSARQKRFRLNNFLN